jgi:hypothetical protein
MRFLPAPQIDHRKLYQQAIAQTQDAQDRTLLASIEDEVVRAGLIYTDAMQNAGAWTVDQITLTAAQKSLVRELYDKRLVSKSGSCRWAYDAIKNYAAMCPYCIDGEVYELDHFLGKYDFPELNILPNNLLPICHPCNHIKSKTPPGGPQQTLLHPYFDLLPEERWLFARVDQSSNGPVVNYWVDLDIAKYPSLAPRLTYHFELLQLDGRMRGRSAKILVELEGAISEHLGKLGPAAMSEHFLEESERYFKRHGNVLEAAAYWAAGSSASFCAGEFRS